MCNKKCHMIKDVHGSKEEHAMRGKATNMLIKIIVHICTMFKPVLDKLHFIHKQPLDSLLMVQEQN